MSDAARRLKPVEDAPAVVWGEPPPSTRAGRGKIKDALRVCLDRPGEWARFDLDAIGIKTKAHQCVGHMKRGIGAPAGKWEFTGDCAEGRNCLYARYLGPEDGEA